MLDTTQPKTSPALPKVSNITRFHAHLGWTICNPIQCNPRKGNDKMQRLIHQNASQTHG